jgi:glycosyltransferase involved in cell wall biosynthesis
MKNIHIGADSFAFRMQNYGGVTNVIENLARELNGNSAHGISFSFYETIPQNWISRVGDSMKSNKFYLVKRIIERFIPQVFQKRDEMDLRFLGYHFDPVKELYNGIPLITMVYDFIPERYPELFNGSSPHLDKLEILKRTTLAVCISEETKKDLYKYVQDFQGKTVVIPLASKFPLSQHTKVGSPLKVPYLLYVGRRDVYKNVNILLASLNLIPEIEIILFGGGDLTEQEKSIIGFDNLARVQCINGADSFLQACYENAIALVFPSKHEGFGLPILEAMSLGCPVIASDIDVFHELFDNAITYFTQSDVLSLVQVVEMLRSNDVWRNERIRYGLERAKLFSWEKAARIFSQSCKQIASQTVK